MGINGVDAAHCEIQRRARAEGVPGITGDDQPPPIETVRGMAGDEEQENTGKKLRQTDETEIERPLRYFVDLPANGDGLHFRGENNTETHQLERTKLG